MNAASVISVAMGVVYAAMWMKEKVRSHGTSQSSVWIRPFATLIGWHWLYDRLLPLLQQVAMQFAVLEGGCRKERLIEWAAERAASAYACAFAAWVLASVTDAAAIGWLGTFVGGLLPVVRAKELRREVEQRRVSLLLELPDLLARLLVLVNAGENVRQALVRTVQQRPEQAGLLYEELAAALTAIERGESMHSAIEQFGQRCAVPEVKQFAAVLLMNAKRGGETFIPALRDLTRQMWEKRKAAARTLGEQASSRLAFPLAMMFMLIMVLVGTPALMSMQL